MNEPKVYVPKSSAKQVSERLLKISFKAAEFRDFMNQHINDKGYIKLCISPRRETGQYGDTHCIWLDTWKPGNKEGFPKQPQPTAEQQSLPNKETDDVPF